MVNQAVDTSHKVKGTVDLQNLLDRIQTYYPSADMGLIKKAYQMAKKAHTGQARKDGSEYITHPLAVACILADLQMDIYTIITGLLHDVVEDTPVSLFDIQKEFDSKIAFLVDGVSKISHLNFKDTYQKDSENIRKMIVAMSRDVRVILVKLADRLHNMRTLQYLPAEKQNKVAMETLDIYAPLASRLGMNSIKVELEDLAFKYSNPENYKSLAKQMDSEKLKVENYIKEIIAILNREIKEKMNIEAEIKGRPKNIYSIHQKMLNQNLDYHEVYDVLAFRVCVEKLEECYKVLGVIHALWKPVPGRFKDYISIPKVNGYQSLHTTVLAEEGRRIEVQIRTSEMHLLAEKGIAAHWKYKSKSWKSMSSIDEETLKKFNWLQDLVNLHKGSQHFSEFLESVKVDLFDKEIYIFTPKGDVKEFPTGATPIDFAYAIHTDIGHKVSGARVNSRQVPLKYKLKNGDKVEVVTSKHQTPSEEWLKYCVTSKAKSKIKNFLRMESRVKAVEIGQRLFEKELRSRKIKPEAVLNTPEWAKYMKENGLNKKEDVYIRLAYGKVLVQDLFSVLMPELTKLAHTDVLPGTFQNEIKYSQEGISDKSTCPVMVDGMGNIMVHFAKCCRPLPGDSIVGFISRGKGITVHRHSCSTLLSMDVARYVDVQWNASSKAKHKHVSLIQIVVNNVPGVLNQISAVFAEQNVNIFHLEVSHTKDMKSIIQLNVEVRNLQQLQELVKSLRSAKNIISVTRKE